MPWTHTLPPPPPLCDHCQGLKNEKYAHYEERSLEKPQLAHSSEGATLHGDRTMRDVTPRAHKNRANDQKKNFKLVVNRQNIVHSQGKK